MSINIYGNRTLPKEEQETLNIDNYTVVVYPNRIHHKCTIWKGDRVVTFCKDLEEAMRVIKTRIRNA